MIRVCVLVMVAWAACAADWPNWRGPQHDGISRESGWQAELGKTAWRAQVGIGFASVAVADGRLFTLGHNGKKKGGLETLTCFDASTGEVLWTETYGQDLLDRLHEGGPAATPAVDGKQVYSIGKAGRLACLQVSDGKRLWQADLVELGGQKKVHEWGFAGSPLVVGELLYVEAGPTLALNKMDGTVVWKGKDYTPAYASPVHFTHGDRQLLATLKTEGLELLDAKDGSSFAFHEWKTSFATNATTPLIVGDQLFISTGYNRGCSLFDIGNGVLTPVYHHRKLSNHMANSVLIDGHVYGFDGNAHFGPEPIFVCMRLRDGKIVWRHRGLKCGTITAADGKLIVLSEGGELHIAEANTEGFDPIASRQVLTGKCWTVPVLANGRLYCRNAAGELVCLDLRP
jgi:outer membrane protein assembly factor BamB